MQLLVHQGHQGYAPFSQHAPEPAQAADPVQMKVRSVPECFPSFGVGCRWSRTGELLRREAGLSPGGCSSHPTPAAPPGRRPGPGQDVRFLVSERGDPVHASRRPERHLCGATVRLLLEVEHSAFCFCLKSDITFISGHICSTWPFQRQEAARRLAERRRLPTREPLDSYVIWPQRAPPGSSR